MKVIFIVGTNGKTTTTTLLNHIFTTNGKTVIQNSSGANLLNGIASALLLHASTTGKVNSDIALFEIDENAFPLACKEITPDAIIFLNLFRDQLDRYGEINTIALKWQEALSHLPHTTKLFLNADDPQIAFLGQRAKQKVLYFGIDEKGQEKGKIDHVSDSTYCPNCGEKLKFIKSYYSHLGVFTCPACSFTHPKNVFSSSPLYPLAGIYNKYNVHAAILVASALGVPDTSIENSLSSFQPVFGRQEMLVIDKKNVEIVLAKNPASFNQALRTVLDQKVHHIMLVLNDRIADGTDVSWIWDIDLELLKEKNVHLTISGDRVYDMSLRAKYADLSIDKIIIEPHIDRAISLALKKTEAGQTLAILPTYTAMLEVRKILTGKKIL